MGTTIKRQPITTSIPAAPDYKFLNITNFGGLQKSSNPFVVSSNTASDCLNVYVDEDNALSTRPRLEAVKDLKKQVGADDTEIIGVYDTHDGLLFHCKTDTKYFEYLDAPKYKLPVGYTLLEYIENDGSQEGINIGAVKRSAAVNLYFKGQLTTATATSEYGSRSLWSFGTTGFEDWCSCAFATDGYCVHMLGYGSSIQSLSKDRTPVKTSTSVFSIERINGRYYYDGVLSDADFTHVVASNTSIELTEILPFIKARLYEFKMSSEKGVVVHCVPCKRTLDGAVGLYDMIRGSFYTNGNYISGPIEKSSKDYFETTVTPSTYGLYYKRSVLKPYTYTLVSVPENYTEQESAMVILKSKDDYTKSNIILGDVPKNKCKIIEQNDTIYLLDGVSYSKITNNTISKVEGYVPLTTVGKNKRTITSDEDGVKKYEYDTEGSPFESINILSDKYRESYFWDGTAGSVPKLNSVYDEIKNLDYKLLEHSSWTETNEVLFVTNDYVLLKDVSVPQLHLNLATISSTGQVLSFNTVSGLPNDISSENALIALNNDILFVTDKTSGVVVAFKYNPTNQKFEPKTVSQNESTELVNDGVILKTKITDDFGFYVVFYSPNDAPERTAAYMYRLSDIDASEITINKFMNIGNESGSGPIDIEAVWSKKCTTTIGYYFLTFVVAKVINTNKNVIYGACVAEAPWFPNVTMEKIFDPVENTNIKIQSIFLDYSTNTITFIHDRVDGWSLAALTYSVETDTSDETVNPYKLSAKTTSKDLLFDLNFIDHIYATESAFWMNTDDEILVANSLDDLDGYTSIALDIHDVHDFRPNQYVVYGENNQFVLKYIGSSEQPSFEITRHINTANYDVLELLRLRDVFNKSRLTIRFDNNTWFASENYTFYTAYNDLSYIPLSSYNDLGETYENITGLSIVNDNILAAYKRNRVYIITPVTVNNQLTYSYTETKNVIGNVVEDAPILTILTEMPVIVSYDGIYALNQLENVQSSDRITSLISEAINPNWLKESTEDVDRCITMNRLYWTYFILPHKKVSNGLTKDTDYTKIYLLDNRTQNWFYWELPIYVISAMVKNNKTHFVDVNGELYTLETSDIINKINKELTEYYDDLKQPTVIPWRWTSQILSFNTINYSKRLVDTTFVLTDTDSSDSYALNYRFKAFRKNKNAETTELTLTNDIEYVESITKRTMIPRFNFLQFTLSNTEDDQKLNNNKFRLVGLGLKYVLLGGLY